jgi:hypothetical protein
MASEDLKATRERLLQESLKRKCVQEEMDLSTHAYTCHSCASRNCTYKEARQSIRLFFSYSFPQSWTLSLDLLTSSSWWSRGRVRREFGLFSARIAGGRSRKSLESPTLKSPQTAHEHNRYIFNDEWMMNHWIFSTRIYNLITLWISHLVITSLLVTYLLTSRCCSLTFENTCLSCASVLCLSVLFRK